ncbi:hypothetical protein ACIRF8_11555 [Streptomyces sp. NPDC102406]|uniref:hypothetical protein n=1 Tax=Streptomyces sp. NPDC102406 TaxID=3366171 RepID=UPI003826C10F
MSAPPDEQHPSAGDLALMALNDDETSPGTTSHVHGCPACTATLDLFVRVLDAGRGGAVPEVIPPESVWEAIRRRL